MAIVSDSSKISCFFLHHILHIFALFSKKMYKYCNLDSNYYNCFLTAMINEVPEPHS